MHITLRINISEEGLEQRGDNEIVDALEYAAERFRNDDQVLGIPNRRWLDYTIYRDGEIVGTLIVDEGSALK